jgi:subtilisin family serine protease
VSQSSRRAAARLPLLSVAVATAFAFIAPLAAAPGPQPRADQDTFIVKFKAGTAERGNAALRQRKLDDIGRSQGLHLGQQRRLAVGADVIRSDHPLTPNEAKALVMRLRADPRVQYAEAETYLQPAFTPNDTRYAEQWNYFDSTGGINAPAAWDITNGAGEVVAILDTGITAHSDLADNLVAGYDFVSTVSNAGDGDGRDADPSEITWALANECGDYLPAHNSIWHGTHVAGIVGAVTNNGKGVAGIAHGAKVQPVRVYGKCDAAGSDTSDAIIWAAGGSVAGIPANPTPAKVINISLAIPANCSPAMQEAIDTANSLGAVVVVAAGPGYMDASTFTPGNCANVVNVTANDRNGDLAYYSNYGFAVDLVAPGGDSSVIGIVSTFNAGTTVPGDESYFSRTGTSKSAPHVAAVIALARAAGADDLDVDDMTALLQYTARPMTSCTHPCGAGIVDAGAAVALAATDPALLVLPDPATSAEGDAGTHTIHFRPHLSRPVGSDVSFTVYTSGGSGSPGSDYDAWSSTFTIPAGQTSVDFPVTVHGDTTQEADEVIEVTLTDASGPVLLARALAQGTIQNDDAYVLTAGVPLGPRTATARGMSFPFALDVPVGATDVHFETSAFGGTEYGDADLYVRYGAMPTLTEFDCLSAVDYSEEACNVPARAGRWYGMVYAYSPYYSVYVSGSYRVPDVDISVGNGTVTEGDSGTRLVTFTVALSGPTSVPVYYNIATADGSALAGSDYAATEASGEVIPAGQVAKTFSVPVYGDTVVEGNETFAVNLSYPQAANPADMQGIGTIATDDGAWLSVSDASVVEGNSGSKSLGFTVSLVKPLANDVTFNASTQSGTAVVGNDFVGMAPTGFTIPAGQLSIPVNVAINGDATIEPNETLLLNLSSIVGATPLDGQGVGTIVNDDQVGLKINDVSVAEGNAGTRQMTFTVSLTQATNAAVGFSASTQGGTATNGVDFVGFPPTAFSIPAGQLSKVVNVTINGDTAVEANETFQVFLSSVTGAALVDGAGLGTITNDDTTQLSIGDAAIAEGNAGTKVMTFTVSLSGASASAVTYDIATANNSATAGSDYVAGSLVAQSIPAGQLSKTFSVTINGDAVVEPNEILRANVTNASVPVTDAQGTGTIINDDGPVLSIADAGFVEGDGDYKLMAFKLTLSQAAATNVTVDIATAAGTAAESDFGMSGATGFVIPAGQTSATFSVQVFGDTVIEGNETFFVNLSNANVSLADGQAKGTITNDDGPVLFVSDAAIGEGDSGTTILSFAVNLSQPANAPVTFNFTTIAGTALAGPDYVPVSVTGLTIPAGQLSKVISVVVRGDLVDEADETVQGVISMGNVSIKDGVGIGTIVDND